MTEEGKIFFSGACLDGALGLIVYQAESFGSGLEMFKDDPLVRSGILETQLHPFKTTGIYKQLAKTLCNRLENLFSQSWLYFQTAK